MTRIVIVITCIAASLLELIDTTVVNVCLRHIAGSVGASTTDVAWVVQRFSFLMLLSFRLVECWRNSLVRRNTSQSQSLFLLLLHLCVAIQRSCGS